MSYLKVEGYSNLLRDPKTNSIINNNTTEYQQYLIKRDIKSEKEQKVQDLEKDLAALKEDINEIKFLLRGLINESR
jgi:hypothetical protein